MNGRPEPGVPDLVRDVVDGYLPEDEALLGAREQRIQRGGQRRLARSRHGGRGSP